MNANLRERMVDAAQSDDRWTPEERETGINFAKPDDQARVQTGEPGLIRRLLKIPAFEIDFVDQRTQDGSVRIEAEDLEEEFDGRRRLTYVSGHVPVGALKISATGRKSNSHAAVVSSHVPEDA